MDNSTQFMVEGIGKVILKLTFRKELTLSNVFYMPKVRKNLISSSLLNSESM